MILERDKIYKVKHSMFLCRNWTNYVIFAPIYDIKIPDGFFDKDNKNEVIPIRDIKTHFTVCLDKSIITRYDKRPSLTGLDRFCDMLTIENEDYSIIREAITKLGHGYKYNRKLNKIVVE